MKVILAAATALCLITAEPAGSKGSPTIIHCDDRGCSDKPLAARTITGYAARPQRGSVSLAGVVGPLAAKAQEIQAACGSRVVSAMRHGRRAIVRGSGRRSLHASGRAVDMAGNPTCIYAHLQGWQGGYSIDYKRVAHVHISYAPNGREWGSRFSHWQPGKKRYAKRHTRYAAATRR